MQTPLNASASTAGALFSGNTFEVPQFQREYSWQQDEVEDLWTDLSSSLDASSYFLGLVILTDEDGRKHVVDGQQRLVTLTLLATALYFEASRRDRSALADRIQSEFLRSINYETDATDPRVILSDPDDNNTLQYILDNGEAPLPASNDDSVSARISSSFRFLKSRVERFLNPDPFRLLGKWADFITNRLYFAVFVHPDPATAYQVFEVINTRGRELTTADLLKNFVLSQAAPNNRASRYEEWRSISRNFPPEGASNTFVQYIRHVVTVNSGHILPKDLFSFLARRAEYGGREPPTPDELVKLLEFHLPVYLQMIDPSAPGPAERNELGYFAAFNALGVITVRPILLALHGKDYASEGLDYLLRLVVRRIVVGNLGTGNVERKFAEAARCVASEDDWTCLRSELSELDPDKDGFVDQLRKRSLNKGTLAFLRRSAIQRTIIPDSDGELHFVWPKNAGGNWNISPEDGSYWASTIGNTFLSTLNRRPPEASENWPGFKASMLPNASDGELVGRLESIDDWSVSAIERIGAELAGVAGEIWYS